jgi:hypothetical protein
VGTSGGPSLLFKCRWRWSCPVIWRKLATKSLLCGTDGSLFPSTVSQDLPFACLCTSTSRSAFLVFTATACWWVKQRASTRCPLDRRPRQEVELNVSQKRQAVQLLQKKQVTHYELQMAPTPNTPYVLLPECLLTLADVNET